MKLPSSLMRIKTIGVLLCATDQPKLECYYIPKVGLAPKWCSFLENITEELEERDLKRDGTMPGAATCQILCVILVALQTYWFGLIIQAVIRQSKSKDGKIQDVRENKKKEKAN